MSKNESGLEPAPHDFPEVSGQRQAYNDYPEVHDQQNHQKYPVSPYQPHGSPQLAPNQEYAVPPAYGGQPIPAPYTPPGQPEKTQEVVASVAPVSLTPSQTASTNKRNRTIFGCSTAVFVLSCIIALLAAAVIGLSAATALEARRANGNATKLAALASSTPNGPSLTDTTSTESSEGGSSAEGSSESGSPSSATRVTVTTTVTGTPSATSTSSRLVDDGCSTDPEGVNKSTYKSWKVVGEKTFTRYCNRDLKGGAAVLVLFMPTFSDCMDACGAYSGMMPKAFGTTDTKAICNAVTYVPDWVDREAARKANTRGNCFLKAGATSESDLSGTGNTVVHAALVTS
ncbi:hypothetical protein QBC35DRAFT_480544 [Podospora australis]|uniref:Uncharacterized protein n=1 Tax=Podospora australis TaxID=1536484 RepID=A0AAN6X6E9_9PEZI|nr:hypothetical protein QBC35DRAFT_480544 [Podospora australis]